MVVHPHAAALDGLTAASAQAKAAFEEEEAEEDRGEEGGGDSGGAPSLSSAAGVAGAGVGWSRSGGVVVSGSWTRPSMIRRGRG